MLVLVLALCSLSLAAIGEVVVEATNKYKTPLFVKRNADQFSIVNPDYEEGVQRCFVDKILKDLSPRGLKNAVNNGNLSIMVETAPDGSAKLVAKPKLKGGGLIAGQIAYWGTKGTIYGALLTGIMWNIRRGNTGSAALTDSGPTQEMLQDIAITAAIEGAQISMGPATPVVAVALSHSPRAAEACGQVAQGAVSAGVAATAQAVGWVESAATWMGAVFTAMPWLP